MQQLDSVFFDSDNFGSIANEHAVENAAEHLINEIAHQHAARHLGTAISAVHEAIERHESHQRGWEDNVPPDLTDDFDFLL